MKNVRSEGEKAAEVIDFSTPEINSLRLPTVKLNSGQKRLPDL
ncbi:hypothetical protein ABXS75_08815 [Roseburia hominis]